MKNQTEQIELLNIGGKIYVSFRNTNQILYDLPGRTYGHITDSSLKRVVKLMNRSDLCDCAVKLQGRFVSTVAWRKHPESHIYSASEYAEMQEEKEDIHERG